MDEVPVTTEQTYDSNEWNEPTGEQVSVEHFQQTSEPLIYQYIGKPNIADMLDESKRNEIGRKVAKSWELDKNTRAHREDHMQKAIDCAMQVIEFKSYPWEKASNVKYPLLTTAAIEFAARAYGAIMQDGRIVKGKIFGKDEKEEPIMGQDGQPTVNPATGQPDMKKVEIGKQKRADRIAEFMNWQLTEQMDYWEEDMDKLLHILPIVGCMFKKTYYEPYKEEPCSHYIFPTDVFVRYDARNVENAVRITHVMDMVKNDIIAKQRQGIFLDFDIGLGDGGIDITVHEKEQEVNYEDHNIFYTILEQHCWLDLDDDGYEEPYIVTILKKDSKVLRIVPRYMKHDIDINDQQQIIKIEPMCFFTKFGFIPSLDGGFYDIGFGDVLYPLNEAINTTLNSLIDAGHLANTGGGLIGGNIRVKAGNLRLAPGEYKVVNNFGGTLRDNIVDLNTKEPSSVLFQLLGFLVQAGDKVGNIKDILSGALPVNAPATTTIAVIENGLSTFKSIYKRLHRSLKQELKKIFNINYMFLSEKTYQEVLDDPLATIEDFSYDDVDVCPVSDPALITDMQRMAKTQALYDFLNDPMFNGLEIRKRIMQNLGQSGLDTLIVPPPPPPPPDPVEQKLKMLSVETVELQNNVLQEQVTDAKENRQIRAFKESAAAKKEEEDSELEKARVIIDANKNSGALTDSMINLVMAVEGGRISPLAGVNILITQFGMPPESASTFFQYMVTNPQPTETQEVINDLLNVQEEVPEEQMTPEEQLAMQQMEGPGPEGTPQHEAGETPQFEQQEPPQELQEGQ